jgi:hypothetical protein
MKYLKMGFVFAVALSLTSFAYLSTDDFGKEELFKAFINEFKQVQLPNTLTFKSDYHRVNKHEVSQSGELLQNSIIKKSSNKPKRVLGKDYVTFIPGINSGMMSRIGPTTYTAEVMLASNKQYTAVIYSESRPFDYTVNGYTLATFDNTGKQIYAKHIGESSTNGYIKMAFSKNMSITINNISINQETNKNTIENTKKWFITPVGKILIHDFESGSNKKRNSIKVI